MKQPSRQVHTQVKKQFFTATGVGPSPPKKKKGGDTLSLLSRFTSPPTTDTNLPLTHRSLGVGVRSRPKIRFLFFGLFLVRSPGFVNRF
jgi:hypothetical protein